MKAIVLHAKNDLRYEDVADVSITKSTQVLVKMLYGGICGSDKHYYSLGANGSFEVKHPFVLGHEGSGIVEEVGADVKSVKKGDMVVFRPALACGHCKFCNKGMYRYCENATHFGSASTMPHTPGIFSEYAVAEEVQCLKVVDVDPKVAALAEPLSVAFAGAHALGNIMGRNVAVMGAGPVGTLCALAIKSLGVKSVTVFDVRNAPLEACKKAGLENVCNTLEEPEKVAEFCEHKGYFDAGLDATGNGQACTTLMKMITPEGVLSQVGMYPTGRTPQDLGPFLNKGLVWHSVFRFYEEFDAAGNALNNHLFDPSSIITDVVDAKDCMDGMNAAMSPDAIKVLYKF